MSQQGYEMLLARYTWTATGDPLTLEQARDEFGKHVQPWTRIGWFWCVATATSAVHIRAEGHRAVGERITTWIPAQSAPLLSEQPEPSGNHRSIRRGDHT